MSDSASVIEYGTYPTRFQAENDIALATHGSTMNAYVIEALSGGDYLVIVARTTTDLDPLTDSFGVQVNTN